MMCAGRGDQRSFDIESPRLDGVRKIRRHGHKPPESGDLCPAIRVDEDGFLRYRLAVETILAVKVSFLYVGRHNQEKKDPTDAWEQVYWPAMVSWHHMPVGFEVCQVAGGSDPKI